MGVVVRALKVAANLVGYVEAPANSKLIGIGSDASNSVAVQTVFIDYPGEPDFQTVVYARSYYPYVPIPMGVGARVGVKNGYTSVLNCSVLFEVADD